MSYYTNVIGEKVNSLPKPFQIMIESTFVCTHEIKACWGLESRNMVSRKKAREATRMGNFPPCSIDSFHVRESGPRRSSSLLPSYSKCHRPMTVRVPSASADDRADRPRARAQPTTIAKSVWTLRSRSLMNWGDYARAKREWKQVHQKHKQSPCYNNR